MKSSSGVSGPGSNLTKAVQANIPHNMLRDEWGVTVRQARLRIRGRRGIALKWIVQNERTGKTCTFDNLGDADAFFESEAARNVFG